MNDSNQIINNINPLMYIFDMHTNQKFNISTYINNVQRQPNNAIIQQEIWLRLQEHDHIHQTRIFQWIQSSNAIKWTIMYNNDPIMHQTEGNGYINIAKWNWIITFTLCWLAFETTTSFRHSVTASNTKNWKPIWLSNKISIILPTKTTKKPSFNSKINQKRQ